MYMTFMEDSLMNYLLHRIAKSLFFIKKIGYRYKRSSESITKKLFKIPQTKLKFYFIYFKFLFEYSKNTKYEKDMLNHRFSKILNELNIQNSLLNNDLKKDYYFYYNVINSIINNIYISDENKILLKNYKKIIEQILV